MGKALGRPTGSSSRIGVSPTAVGEGGKRVEEYAIVHQAGMGPIPQRRFLGVSQDDAKAVEAVIQRIMLRAETGVLAGANPRITRPAANRSLPGADIE